MRRMLVVITFLLLAVPLARPAPGTLRVHVVDEATGAPVPLVLVCVYSRVSDSGRGRDHYHVTAFALTDAAGRAVVDLPPRAARLGIGKDASTLPAWDGTGLLPGPITVVLRDGVVWTVRRGEPRVPPGHLRVTVRDAVSGAPIEGARLTLRKAGPGPEDSREVRLGWCGTIEIHAAETSLEAVAEGYLRRAAIELTDRIRESGNLTLPLDPAGMLAGRILTLRGEAVGSAEYELVFLGEPSDLGLPVAVKGTTSEDGRFRIEELRAGPWSLTAAATIGHREHRGRIGVITGRTGIELVLEPAPARAGDER